MGEASGIEEEGGYALPGSLKNKGREPTRADLSLPVRFIAGFYLYMPFPFFMRAPISPTAADTASLFSSPQAPIPLNAALIRSPWIASNSALEPFFRRHGVEGFHVLLSR